MKKLWTIVPLIMLLHGCAHIDFRQLAEDERYCAVEAVKDEVLKILPLITLELVKESPDFTQLYARITAQVQADLADQTNRITACAIAAFVKAIPFFGEPPTQPVKPAIVAEKAKQFQSYFASRQLLR